MNFRWGLQDEVGPWEKKKTFLPLSGSLLYDAGWALCSTGTVDLGLRPQTVSPNQIFLLVANFLRALSGMGSWLRDFSCFMGKGGRKVLGWTERKRAPPRGCCLLRVGLWRLWPTGVCLHSRQKRNQSDSSILSFLRIEARRGGGRIGREGQLNHPQLVLKNLHFHEGRVWRHSPIIPVLRRPRQEDGKFKANLLCRIRTCLRKQKQ